MLIDYKYFIHLNADSRIFYIFAPVPIFGALETFKFLKIMHFKKYPAKVIRELSDWSCELTTLDAWAKDGFSERDYERFCHVTYKFLKMLLRYKPTELVESLIEKEK